MLWLTNLLSMYQLLKRRSTDVIVSQSSSRFFMSSSVHIQQNMATSASVVMDIEPKIQKDKVYFWKQTFVG